MKIALDPFMLRHVPLTELPAVVAELGYEYIELSPREDVTPFLPAPEGQKRAIELTVDLGCDVMNSEFNGRPEAPSASEGQFWGSLEELLPIFESCAGNLAKVRQYVAKYF
jgi:myo-inositol catabolism protein IolH